MTDSRTLPVAAAAVTAPAWIPTLAAVAPSLILGMGIVAALVWLFSDDKPKPAAATPDGNPPPAPNPPPKQERGFWDSFWNDGWFSEDEAKPAHAAPAVRTAQTPVRPAPRAVAPAAVTPQAVARPQANAVAPVRRQLASPALTIPAAPISAPKPAVTVSATPAHVASQAPAVIHQAATAPTQSRLDAPVPVTVKPTPSKFQLFAPKVNREDLAAIFAYGKRLTRRSAVAALVARGVKKTTAYNVLRDGGRFTGLLAVGEDGLLAFNG